MWFLRALYVSELGNVKTAQICHFCSKNPICFIFYTSNPKYIALVLKNSLFENSWLKIKKKNCLNIQTNLFLDQIRHLLLFTKFGNSV